MSEVRSNQELDETPVTVVAEFFKSEPEGRRGSGWDSPAVPAAVIIDYVLIEEIIRIEAHCFSDRVLRRWEHNILMENV